MATVHEARFYDGKGSETTGRCPQNGTEKDLTALTLAQCLLSGAARLHVDVLDQQHHDEHEACDHQRVLENTQNHGHRRSSGPRIKIATRTNDICT